MSREIKRPVKPRRPKKPQKPDKTQRVFQPIDRLYLSDLTLGKFLTLIATQLECSVDELDVDNILLSCNSGVCVGEMADVANPNYNSEYKRYEHSLERYKKRLKEYPERMKLYEATMPVYEAWLLSEKKEAKLEQLQELQQHINILESQQKQLLSEADSIEKEKEQLLSGAAKHETI